MVLNPTPEMVTLLRTPAFEAAGLGALDLTVTETYTFERVDGNSASEVIFEREREYDADFQTLSWSKWSVTNTPTIDDIETDQAINTTALANGTTILTITGSNFGAEVEDIQVMVRVVPKVVAGTTVMSRTVDNLATFRADILSGVDTDDAAGGAELTCSLLLEMKHRDIVPTVGTRMQVSVINTLRLLQSSPDNDITLV